ncbi:MAG: ABC transporter permease [Acidisphaera sp.]|nr:ABC transporter permease [Acidisphaera sp.]
MTDGATGARASGGEWLFHAICVLVLLFLMVPTLLIVPMSFSATAYLTFPPAGFSFEWYHTFLTDPEWIDATLFSLRVAALTTLASTVVGTMGALALVRGRLPGRQTIEALLLAPLIVPPIIVAIGVYLQFAPLGLTGTLPGFVLIHTALAVPYVVLVVSAALQRLPPSLEMAGLNLGGSRLACFRRITLPLIAPSILAGAVFAFLASFDETVVSFFISGVEHKTVTRKLFEDIEFNLSPVIAAASTVFVVSTILMMWLADASKKAATQ